MKSSKKQLMVSAMALTLIATGTAPAFAVENNGEGAALDDQEGVLSTETAAVAVPTQHLAAQGFFSYDQKTVTPNETIRTLFSRAVAALCQATEDFAVSNPLGWQLSVTGEVSDVFTANVGELAGEESVQSVMTCTCGGNPADGGATITAEVKGIPVSHLLDRAEARSGVNTLTFVASDGTETALPLAYVVGHHGVLSYEINGEDLSASVGGNNQLWMTGAPANYFVRDVVEIRVSQEAQPPANPGEDMTFPNSPNVGILSASVE